MAKFVPQPGGKHASSDLKLGEATVQQLHEAIKAGDYAKIAMAVGRDTSHLSEDIRAALKAAHEAFLTTVWNYVLEVVPPPDTWQVKKAVTLSEAEKAIQALNEVSSELAKIAAHEILPQTKLIALHTLIERSQRVVRETILKHGDSIRNEFVGKIGDLVEVTNDTLNVGAHDHDLLLNLSRQILDVYNLSCLLEDSVPGWHLGKVNRQPLRIIAKRLTQEAGISTDLPIRPVTNPTEENQKRRDNQRRT
jgi:hypothetical protein